ncbi:hypothetical protein JRQ81_002763 [Phrynocephalus forsythii]|uniref:Uncharacterized protein n=1 Tax=Phrynocephalus forsythii TaxID=171643 RepID=A0A9Q0XJ89_9SAUR|nr:hypothetical protein JRQ81_002763 [Phrynocephalus forsythii]
MQIHPVKCGPGFIAASIRKPTAGLGFLLRICLEQSSSPQKQGVKARSKSTEEIQPAKKAFHTPQKSLPNQMDGDESKVNRGDVGAAVQR